MMKPSLKRPTTRPFDPGFPGGFTTRISYDNGWFMVNSMVINKGIISNLIGDIPAKMVGLSV